MNGRTGLCCALAIAAMAGCAAVGPDYQRPPVELPPAWRDAAPLTSAEASSLSDGEWWRAFGDADLAALVDRALQENKDLRVAVLRVQQYEARLQVSQSAAYPAVTGSADAARERVSERLATPLPLAVAPTRNRFELGLRASWELDLWGRVRRADEAALADLLSVQEARQALVMSLVAEVATRYVQLLALDSELGLARRQVELLARQLALLEKKRDAGGVSDIAVTQRRAELERAAAGLPARERELATLENALSLLLGGNPGPIRRADGLQALQAPLLPSGLPSGLLARRPDIRRAEQDLVAANARIGVARSQMFPTISLTGLLGAASASLSDLTLRSANVGSLGAGVLGTIFDAGRVEGQVREAEALRNQLVVAYAQSIQQALREVEDALIWRRKSLERRDGLQRQVDVQERLVMLERRRSEGGSGSQLDVLDAEIRAVASRLDLVDTQRETLASLIAVYKSLGGGWVSAAAQRGDATAAR